MADVKNTEQYLSDLENMRSDAIAVYDEILNNPEVDVAQRRLVAADIFDRTGTYKPKGIEYSEMDTRLTQAIQMIAMSLLSGVGVDVMAVANLAKTQVLKVAEEVAPVVEYSNTTLLEKLEDRDANERKTPTRKKRR